MSLAEEVLQKLNLEYIDISPDETEEPHKLLELWNTWNKNEGESRKQIVEDWLSTRLPNATTLEEVQEHVKQNRHNKLYNNVDYLKLVLEQVVHPEDLCWFSDILEDDDVPIEIVRAELAALLRNAYDIEVANGGNPDPLEYYDSVHDIRNVDLTVPRIGRV